MKYIDSMVKIFISTPCYDAMVTMQYTMSLLNLTTFLNSKYIEFVVSFIGNESLITRARNQILHQFMKSDCTHLLFIDSDIEFKPEAILDLLNFDKDVVACTYPKKSFNWNKFMHSMKNENESKESFHSRGLDYAYNLLYNDGCIITQGQFVKVKHVATGFMMIQRNILEKLCKKYTELNIISDNLSSKDEEYCGLFCCMIKNKQYLSEDYSFCERVLNVDGEIWMNIHHNLNHIGKYIFYGDIQHRPNLTRSIFERTFY
jgi:CRISPR/Cas system-associated protein endoribonuclease Cas2